MRPTDAKIQKLATAGVLTAAVLVLTLVSVPYGLGYVHAGDAAVLLTGTLLGGGWGCACAVLGSALADIVLGYTVYIPATVIAKAAASLLAALLTRKMPVRWSMTALVIAAFPVWICYFLYEWPMFGIGVAVGNLAGNFLQSIVGALLAYILTRVTRKIRASHRGDTE